MSSIWNVWPLFRTSRQKYHRKLKKGVFLNKFLVSNYCNFKMYKTKLNYHLIKTTVLNSFKVREYISRQSDGLRVAWPEFDCRLHCPVQNLLAFNPIRSAIFSLETNLPEREADIHLPQIRICGALSSLPLRLYATMFGYRDNAAFFLPLPFKGIIKFISKPYSPQKQTRVHERQIREMFQEGNWFWRNVLIHRQLASEVDRESRSFLACPSSGRTSIVCATATVNTDRILSGMTEEGNHLSCVINFL
jgi:hypothetical protein